MGPGQEPTGDGPAGQEDSGHGQWSPAPVTGRWARPGTGDGPAVEDPAADWEQLAAGAQAGRAEATGAQAMRWSAQTDAEVANEWPGPPLRTAMRNGLLADEDAPAPAAADDDAQTDPGLPRPRPADPAMDHPQVTEEPGNPADGAGPGQPGTGPGERGPGTIEPAAAGKTVPDPDGPAPPARQTRRARSKRAAADLPAEPDAADEWISLLTADPMEE
jgi:hypothetical protein